MGHGRLIFMMGMSYPGRPSLYWDRAQGKHNDLVNKNIDTNINYLVNKNVGTNINYLVNNIDTNINYSQQQYRHQYKLSNQQQYRHQHKLSSQQQYRHQHKLSGQQRYRHQHKLSSQQQYRHQHITVNSCMAVCARTYFTRNTWIYG